MFSYLMFIRTFQIPVSSTLSRVNGSVRGLTICAIKIYSSLDITGCELYHLNFLLSKLFWVTISLHNLALILFGILRSLPILWWLDENVYYCFFKLLMYSREYHARLGISNQRKFHTTENKSVSEFIVLFI